MTSKLEEAMRLWKKLNEYLALSPEQRFNNFNFVRIRNEFDDFILNALPEIAAEVKQLHAEIKELKTNPLQYHEQRHIKPDDLCWICEMNREVKQLQSQLSEAEQYQKFIEVESLRTIEGLKSQLGELQTNHEREVKNLQSELAETEFQMNFERTRHINKETYLQSQLAEAQKPESQLLREAIIEKELAEKRCDEAQKRCEELENELKDKREDWNEMQATRKENLDIRKFAAELDDKLRAKEQEVAELKNLYVEYYNLNKKLQQQNERLQQMHLSNGGLVIAPGDKNSRSRPLSAGENPRTSEDLKETK